MCNQQVIVDYVILWSKSANELNKEVNEYISRDYQPYGQIVINNSGICQTMVLFAEGE